MNNKGFMLAEVVIVSTLLLTTMVGLYSGFSNTYKAYEIRNTYYDAKNVYDRKNLENFFFFFFLLNQLVSNNSFSYTKINNDTFNDNYYRAFLDKFVTTYKIKDIYLAKYDETVINNLANSYDEEFEEYLLFYIDTVKESSSNYLFNSSDYSYVLFAVSQDNTYASLRIR